jgi:hypothetical protein
MSYSATMVLPCKCGAECHIIMECVDDDKGLGVVPIFCCNCSFQVGQAQALAVRTYPTAREALLNWIREAKCGTSNRKQDVA